MARTWPDQESWALRRVDRIGAIHALNDARRAVAEDAAAFPPADARRRQAVTALGRQGEAELAEPSLHPARRKVLEGLGDYWAGLTVFVEHPEVPLDNNTAERADRGPVVGRENYDGSGAVGADRLAALLFSMLQALCLWRLNPRSWLTAYLTACAEAGGEAPAEGERFLPWDLSEERRQSRAMAGGEGDRDTS